MPRYDHQFEDLNGVPDYEELAGQAYEEGAEGAEGEEVEEEEDQGAEGADAGDDGEGGEGGDGGGEGGDGEGGEGDGEDLKDSRDVEIQALRDDIRKLREEAAARHEREEEQAQSASFDEKLTDLRKQKRQAIEEGDTDRQIELDEQMIELHSQRGSRRRQPQGEGQGQGQGQGQDASGSNGQGQGDGNPQYPEAMHRWLGRNEWFRKGKNPEARADAEVIDARLRAQGSDFTSDKHYEEVDKQLSRLHPELSGSKTRSNSVGKSRTNGTGSQGNGRSGKMQITAEDRRQMRAHGLQPENKTHAEAWLKEKKAAARSSK